MREIFDRYLKIRNVYALRDELNAGRLRSKCWVSRSGRKHGGAAFTHGALYHILSNRVYVGDIVHRDRAYPGAHAAIIATEQFDAVQQKLRAGTPPAPGIESRGRIAPLKGKLFDDRGSPMTTAHANKSGRRYFYYVSTARTTRKVAGSLARVSAARLETLLREQLAPLVDKNWLACAANDPLRAIRRVELSAARLKIDLDVECLQDSHASPAVELGHDLAPPVMGRRVIQSLDRSEPRVDRSLVRAIVQARRWHERLASGEVASIEALAEVEQACPIYLGQLLPLACLAPDLIEAIVDGRQPQRLSLVSLIKAGLPMRWTDQRNLFAQFN